MPSTQLPRRVESYFNNRGPLKTKLRRGRGRKKHETSSLFCARSLDERSLPRRQSWVGRVAIQFPPYFTRQAVNWMAPQLIIEDRRGERECGTGKNVRRLLAAWSCNIRFSCAFFFIFLRFPLSISVVKENCKRHLAYNPITVWVHASSNSVAMRRSDFNFLCFKRGRENRKLVAIVLGHLGKARLVETSSMSGASLNFQFFLCVRMCVRGGGETFGKQTGDRVTTRQGHR